MAAPIKDGLDYFPERVEISNELYMLEAEYGIEGYGVWVRLKAWIFRNSYYLKWDKAQQLVFSRREGVDINLLTRIVAACINYGLLDPVVYQQYGILTSKDLQKNYLAAVSRRTSTLMISEYLLIDINEYKNNRIKIVIDSINSVNDDNNPQSKVKESKVKESKDADSVNAYNNSQPETELDRRFDAFKNRYNEDARSVGLPQYRYLMPSRDDIEIVSRVFTAYTHEECLASWEEYVFIVQSSEHKAFPVYKDMIGFLRGGVDKYNPEINPREIMRIHPGMPPTRGDEEERTKRAAERYGMTPEEFRRETE